VASLCCCSGTPNLGPTKAWHNKGEKGWSVNDLDQCALGISMRQKTVHATHNSNSSVAPWKWSAAVANAVTAIDGLPAHFAQMRSQERAPSFP
jgi:hypothetical protein